MHNMKTLSSYTQYLTNQFGSECFSNFHRFFSFNLISLCVVLLKASTIFANVPTILTITGPSRVLNSGNFTDYPPPCSVELTAHISPDHDTKIFTWILKSADITGTCNPENTTITLTPNDDKAIVNFPGFGNASIFCTVAFKKSENEWDTIKSHEHYIEYGLEPNQMTPEVNITGPTEVQLNIAETFSAHTIWENPSFSWSYKNAGSSIVHDLGNGSSKAITFTQEGRKEIKCEMSYAMVGGNGLDNTVDDTHSVDVLKNVTFSVEREDYTKTKYTGDEIVYVHYNIDNDDEEQDSTNNKVYDCEKTYFINGKNDDELCLFKLLNSEAFDDLNCGSVVLSFNGECRIWTANNRLNGTLLLYGQKKSFAWYMGNRSERNEFMSLLGRGIYVEGTAETPFSINLSYGHSFKSWHYRICSASTKELQPCLEDRQIINDKFKQLINCEWGIQIHPKNRLFMQNYNCFAYAADPNLAVFDNSNLYFNNKCGSFWVIATTGDYESPLSMPSTSVDNFLVASIQLTSVQINNLNDFLIELGYQNKVSVTSDGIVFMKKSYISPEHLGVLSAIFVNRLTALHLFNPNHVTNNTFNYSSDRSYFFKSSLFGNLDDCSLDYTGRKVVCFSKLHAARTAKGLLGTLLYSNDLMKNCHPNWEMVSSKCSAGPIIWHRVEQVSSEYGTPCKAFK